MRVIGLMSGTSLDGVDAALVETDGHFVQSFGPGLEIDYTKDERSVLQAAVDAALCWRFEGEAPGIFSEAELILIEVHAKAVNALCQKADLTIKDIDLIGFHGQTVFHEPPQPGQKGRTCQLGDGQELANILGCPVVFDFRSQDMARGGHGAPLAPIYHRLLVQWSGLECPIGILNLGGVANITLVGSDKRLLAFDTGPGNGLIDSWVCDKTHARMDENGQLAARGQVHEASLEELLSHSFFELEGPKSLDRWTFSLDSVRNLTLEDGAATLSEFTARCIAIGLDKVFERPHQLIVCGGGRNNPVLLSKIEQACNLPVLKSEDVGWRGGLVEAEAFAVLAARCKQALPISFPETTGVQDAQTAGRLVHPMS